MSVPDQPYATRAETFASFAEHLNRGKAKFFESVGVDVVMGERAGPFFYDAYGGTRYWNCHCNGGVFNLGHRNARVVDAVRRELDALDIGNHHLVSGHRAALAASLARTTGDDLPGVVFGVGGGEVVDLAIKLARSRSGRRRIVSLFGGFHGHTGLAAAAGDAAYRDPFGPNLPDFVQVPFDDVDAMAAAVDGTTAAVLLETIPATLGMPIPGPGYLSDVEGVCRDNGALLLLDEVQTGLGRTGTFWAYQQDGVHPDVVLTGKGLSGGVYPMSAALLSGELKAFLDDNPFAHLSTTGGSELGCVAARQVVDIVGEPGFLEHVQALGARFETGLAGMPFELRRRGMFMALKYPGAAEGMDATLRLVRHGVFVVFAGNDPSAVQFLPPLTLTDGEADEVIATVRRALS